MPQLLLEILSEEIPARMQAKAEADLTRALMDRLTAAGLVPEGVTSCSGPRRLVAVVEGLPVKSADVVEDIVGPKEGAPEAALQGFMKKAGLSDINQAHVHDVPKKGRVYVAHVRKAGKETAALIAEMVPDIIRSFHWPKSMRWGNGDLRWVRPINRILCTFDGEVVPFEIEGIKAGNQTEGHRVLGRGPFTVRRWDDYSDVLRNKGHVVLDREERREIILTEAKSLCFAQGLELVEDQGLLEEVAGLAEYPQVLMGEMDPAFLDLPPEVIRLSMRTHQKYFAVRDPKKGEGALAPKFIVVANLAASDGGEKIAAGNARVLSARLNDARFFWDNDRRVKLEDRFEKLGSIVFHEKLGTVKDKAERVMALARELAPLMGADPALAERAAKLAKCDLVSDMVGEFPELEGVMGRYYAALQGEPAEVADAIRDHYKPKGPSDEVPSNPVSIAVALADKIVTLAGFWTIGEYPSGSRDPFALRRSALGFIWTVLANDVRIPLTKLIASADAAFWTQVRSHKRNILVHGRMAHPSLSMSLERSERAIQIKPNFVADFFDRSASLVYEVRIIGGQAHVFCVTVDEIPLADSFLPQEVTHEAWFLDSNRPASEEALVPANVGEIRNYTYWAGLLLSFFADRLKVHLREQGARHDLIDAVFALGEDDLVLIVKRVEALGTFLETDDGKNLLAGYKRAANILKAEEKKGESFSGEVSAKALEQDEEKALYAALQEAAPAAKAALHKEDFAGAMKALSGLRAPVDAFFDKVTVNAEDAALRVNRLNLLAAIRNALGKVADFSKIEG